MSNKRESIKKSLGLTEYPWSSDDENNTQSVTESVATTSRRPSNTNNVNVAETSGRTDHLPRKTPKRKFRTKFERDLFFGLLKNVNVVPTSQVTPGPSRPSTSSTEPTESVDLTGSPSGVDLQRIIAIKRLTRSLSGNRHSPRNHCLHNVKRSASSSRGTGSNLTTWSESAAAAKRRESPMWPSFVTARLQSSAEAPGASVQSAWPETSGPSEQRSPPSHSPPLSDIEEDTPASTPADQTVNSAGSQDQTASTVEEVEVDNRGENENPDNVLSQAEANGDENINMEVDVVPTDSLDSPGQKRKREANGDNEPCTVKDFNQSLLRLLECPVCLEWMEPPMSQCRRGHLVCMRCRARLAACPVCRVAFSSVRNRAMEGVAEMLRYPCRHGCGRETRLRRRAAHEASCTARRYRCPAPPCAERAPLPLADMLQHFQVKHLSLLKVGSKHHFSMKMNIEQHDNWLVTVAPDLFHLRVDVDIRTWGVVVYVAYIGPKCNANRFTYEVTVLGQHNERKLVYTRVTHSDLESSSLNVSRQDCFHLTLDQALNFLRYKNRHCEPDKFLDFSVEINKLEVPVATTQAESDS